jgi:Uma2 family endonuclease
MAVMSIDRVPDWAFPPEDGFTAADLDLLPDLPPHTELIDGSLVFVSPQAAFHSVVLDILVSSLRRATPPDLRVRREMTVTLDRKQRPEPDVVVVHADALRGLGQTTFMHGDVVLAVEVVSPESRTRDHERKPMLYAKAGIEHFWLIEREDTKPVLYTYHLDPIKPEYEKTGTFEGAFKLDSPYPIEIDFGELVRM